MSRQCQEDRLSPKFPYLNGDFECGIKQKQNLFIWRDFEFISKIIRHTRGENGTPAMAGPSPIFDTPEARTNIACGADAIDSTRRCCSIEPLAIWANIALLLPKVDWASRQTSPSHTNRYLDLLARLVERYKPRTAAG